MKQTNCVASQEGMEADICIIHRSHVQLPTLLSFINQLKGKKQLAKHLTNDIWGCGEGVWIRAITFLEILEFFRSQSGETLINFNEEWNTVSK